MRRLTLRFLAATLLLLTLSRLGLALWQHSRVSDAGGLWPVIFGGWRIDLSLLAMMVAFPAILSPWLGHRPLAVRVTAWWYRLCWLLLVLLEVATPQFIVEYDTRPNRLFVEYLSSPVEVASMLWHGYKLPIALGLVAWAIIGWLGWRMLSPQLRDARTGWIARVPISAVIFVACLLAARGTLQHRPINEATVAFSSDSMVNTLPLNSFYNVANAIDDMRSERSSADVYPPMDADTMNAELRRSAGLDGPALDARYPSMHRQEASTSHPRPLNLVIIVQESLGAQFVGNLGGRDLTPNIDALSKEGWAFNRAYATGTRSARGLEAITTGFLPTTAEAVLKLPRSQRDFFTVAALLGRQGFHSRFIYGGEAHFDNMRGFFFGNGFNEVVDRSSFVDPVFVGSWGASDEDMFNELHKRLLSDGDKPNFTVAFSVSNHTPWQYPAGRISPIGNPASVENTVRYADYAIGKFFNEAKKSPYWQNTVFLLIADHDARVHGASLVPVEHFHIPALILGGQVPVRSDDRIVSQIDMAPTLLSLIGISSTHPMPGADLTVRDPHRAIMQYGDNFGYLKDDQLVVYEPFKPASQFTYDGKSTLTPATVDPILAKEALANALWPSWAYKEQRYRMPDR
ncbi:phosphoglycerol transferase MdoB-like AlkP superfamily enzyme [Luteibacter rhizovicinus]|uniref:Phosphoglycerol transferase MdoB-like AlkP superfamily enzyme n=1 Tax=Luteibacter rhizovicinus TaxID=242606 RepID=A0A4R3YM57_9GAMM|nr:sulfatase-like hydrolase/transferase [Luteibacter rhizovicinus]TCV93341.1 phosphoglycerol transferase MdoB-like AlkP superfamily enzyme [Luteibacter rhizovicinus]